MYQPRTPGYSKRDPEMRWALPDRVFFACGACHILANAFLERHGAPEMRPIWIKPAAGFVGAHVFVAGPDWAFDYHGYCALDRFVARLFDRARRRCPGWSAELVELPREVLVSEAKSRRIEGLWLREPRQFLHDARPRAERFLDRFPAPADAVHRLRRT